MQGWPCQVGAPRARISYRPLKRKRSSDGTADIWSRSAGWEVVLYAYVDGQQVEWGPYQSKDFALGAGKAIERRLNGQPVRRQDEPLETTERRKS